jgi:hypothetical protein
MKRALFLFASLVAVAGCDPSLQNLDTHGNAPLIIDLDVESPITISATDETGGTVRGPDKGKGERGGITGSFIALGGPVCAIIDPEGTFAGGDHASDGDMDLYVGRAADYTGTPGISMGKFGGEYVDALGVSHELNQNLCIQYDYFGLPGAHAGSASPEFCEVQTDAGVPYLLVGETFSAPPDDAMLTVAVQVRAGTCPTVTESTLESD